MFAVCLGDSISITCTHEVTAGQQSYWALPGAAACPVPHDGITPLPNCSPFTITMISDSSGPTLSSTAMATVTESMDGTTVVCRAGGLASSPLVGNITIRINGWRLLVSLNHFFILSSPGPPSVPAIGLITYSIESALTGSVTFTASSMSSPVSYNASVIGGSVQVTGDTITVTGLSYARTHTVTVTAAICPGIETNSVLIPISFNTEGMLLIQTTVSYCKTRARGVSTAPLTLKMCDTRLIVVT